MSQVTHEWVASSSHMNTSLHTCRCTMLSLSLHFYVFPFFFSLFSTIFSVYTQIIGVCEKSRHPHLRVPASLHTCIYISLHTCKSLFTTPLWLCLLRSPTQGLIRGPPLMSPSWCVYLQVSFQWNVALKPPRPTSTRTWRTHLSKPADGWGLWWTARGLLKRGEFTFDKTIRSASSSNSK